MVGLQPSSAVRLIAMVANFGVVNSMKTSAPEAFSLAIWAIDVGVGHLVWRLGHDRHLAAQAVLQALQYSLPMPSS